MIEIYVNGQLSARRRPSRTIVMRSADPRTNAENNQTNRSSSAAVLAAQPRRPRRRQQGLLVRQHEQHRHHSRDGTGNELANVINGNAGDNKLSGLGGDDTMNGNGGNDTLDGGEGDDTLNGGDGNDTILVNFADSDTIDGGIGHDVVNVSGGSGDEAASVVHSGGLITSLGGLATNVEEVNLDLGGGTDTLDYTGSTAGVTVNLDTGTASGFTTIANIENVTGGSAADTLTGNGAANVLHGGGNGDTINGGGGADQLFGDGGADIISGGTGTDTIDGGAGDDTIDGGAGGDTIDGGGDIDTVTGYGSGYELKIQNGKWVVTNGTDTDTLTNVEKVTINGETYILVDSFADGGFGSVQAAIDSATGGETILIAPGNYTETANYNPTTGLNDPAFANPLGLLINKDGLTLQGVTATGAPINAAGSTLATILSGVQSNWGTNFSSPAMTSPSKV